MSREEGLRKLGTALCDANQRFCYAGAGSGGRKVLKTSFSFFLPGILSKNPSGSDDLVFQIGWLVASFPTLYISFLSSFQFLFSVFFLEEVRRE